MYMYTSQPYSCPGPTYVSNLPSEEDMYSTNLENMNQETLRHRKAVNDQLVHTASYTAQVISDKSQSIAPRMNRFEEIRQWHLNNLQVETNRYNRAMVHDMAAAVQHLPSNVREGVKEYQEELIRQDHEFMENANLSLASLFKNLARYGTAAALGGSFVSFAMGVCGMSLAAWTAIPTLIGGLLGVGIEWKFEVMYNAGKLVGHALVMIADGCRVIGQFLLA